ncbi:MetS family NSS transporter small subunit [Methanothermococcus sp.]|nr:MetS family NSS transporter small subunit [Methanothermococcus sp.]
MNTSAIVMFLFGAIVLWGGSAYFLWKSFKNMK